MDNDYLDYLDYLRNCAEEEAYHDAEDYEQHCEEEKEANRRCV